MRVRVDGSGSVTFTTSGPEVTKDQAMSAEHFHKDPCHVTVGPRGGITRKTEDWRRNGRTQIWKTRPDEWRTPVKYGLKQTDQLTHREAFIMHAAEACAFRDLEDSEILRMAADARAGRVIDSPDGRPVFLTGIVAKPAETTTTENKK